MGRNLGADSLHAWLEQEGWSVTRLAARSGYRLLQVSSIYPERTRGDSR